MMDEKEWNSQFEQEPLFPTDEPHKNKEEFLREYREFCSLKNKYSLVIGALEKYANMIVTDSEDRPYDVGELARETILKINAVVYKMEKSYKGQFKILNDHFITLPKAIGTTKILNEVKADMGILTEEELKERNRLLVLENENLRATLEDISSHVGDIRKPDFYYVAYLEVKKLAYKALGGINNE